ncbi:MAG: hypothetical protein ACRD3Q_20855 [Terriglobales bacterium]
MTHHRFSTRSRRAAPPRAANDNLPIPHAANDNEPLPQAANDNVRHGIVVIDDLPRPLPALQGEGELVRKLLGDRFREILFGARR